MGRAMIFTTTVVVVVLVLACGAPATLRPTALLSATKLISNTSETYASWNIDSSYNRGFFHVNWTNPNLLAGAISLHPSVMRFGGSGNDFLQYDTPSHPCTSAPPAGCTNTVYCPRCMNMTTWNDLYGMANASGTSVLFGLAFGDAAGCIWKLPTQPCCAYCNNKSAYRWNGSNAQEFLQYTRRSRQHLWGVELGNELNNDMNACSIIPSQQVDAILSLQRILEQVFPDARARPKIVGPDTGYLNPEMWLEGLLPAAGLHLHAVTHHVYPGIDRTSWNSTAKLDNALNDIKWYVPIIRKYASHAEIWAGEDGPRGGGEDGTCGGDSSVCGTFSSTLWYADDMALRASKGFSQWQRQDLVGGRYGLLGIQHDNEYLSATSPVSIYPDFWVNFLWKRIMGVGVLDANLSNDFNGTLRGYAHCGKAPSPYAEGVDDGGTLFISWLLINLANEPRSVSIEGLPTYSSWSLTAGAQGVFGKETLLNNKLLPISIADGKAIGKMPVPGETSTKGRPAILPPSSVTFLLGRTSVAINGCKTTPQIAYV